jgi:adenine/guanine/hypoxanthine permease
MQVPNANSPRWWSLGRGDIDATVAQVGFNLAQMVIPVFLLLPVGIPLEFSVARLLPGYAAGFLVGSLGLSFLALRLQRREGRNAVTAHVYGNNVPAIFAYTLAIVLPTYLRTGDPIAAWQIGAAAVIWTGLIKLAAAPFAGVCRRFIPLPASMTVFGAAMYSYLALVLLQRIFDHPLVGIVALAIVCCTVLANLPITRWRIPPFLVAWLIPLVIGISVGYVHPIWRGWSPGLPFVASLGPLRSLILAVPYLSVIAPIAIYQVLQDIASVEGASAAGDNYDARSIVAWDAVATLICGVAGSVVTPVVYALHPPYKAMGARIGFALWTPIIFVAVVMSGLTLFISQLFPWPILAAMIAYVSIGVGTATLRRVDARYLSAVLLGLVLPTGAVVSAVVNSALLSVKVSAALPEVQAALNRSIYWGSIQGLGSGFLFLVLVIAALITEMIDRNFSRAALWCVVAAGFSWFGLMHSPVFRWGAQPKYAAGWLAAAAIAYSARWWGGPSTATPGGAPATSVAHTTQSPVSVTAKQVGC